MEKSIKTAGRGVLKGAGPRPQDDPDVAVVAVARNPRDALAAAYAELNRDEGPAGPPSVDECALDQRCARAFGLARLCSAQTLALCGGDEACLPDAEGRASREAVDLALLALNNSVLITIPSERLDIDGYATLETLLPTYFRGLRQAAPWLLSLRWKGGRGARPAKALRRRPADLRRRRADLPAAREGVRGGGARVRARRGAAARAPGPEPAARAPGPGRGGHAPAPRGAAAARTADAGAHRRRHPAARAPRALRRGPRPRR